MQIDKQVNRGMMIGSIDLELEQQPDLPIFTPVNRNDLTRGM